MNSAFDTNNKRPRNLYDWLSGTWSDRILLILVLGGIAVGWSHIQQLVGSGKAMVDVYYDRTLLAEYPLHGKKPVHIPAEGEIGISDIVIADGSVFISASPCHSKRCIQTGHQHRIGDTIVCVPNRILVAIRGDAKGFDAVVE
ncbi:MAG: NusG domain II-containing protein [Mariprofundaceae bacterium]